MDKDIINRKLESLRRCVARITSKMPITREVLRSNYDLQDIIALNLERAVAVIDQPRIEQLAVMAYGGTVEYFVDTVCNYPTLAEAYKIAAFDGLNKL